MFIDASVIVAILGREPGHEEFVKRLAAFGGPFFLSPLVKFEATAARARQKAGAAKIKVSSHLLTQARQAVDSFIEDVAAQEISISPEIGVSALEAWSTYGKAVGHPAALNFGNCFAYGCAKVLRVGLIYQGYDFTATDLA